MVRGEAAQYGIRRESGSLALLVYLDAGRTPDQVVRIGGRSAPEQLRPRRFGADKCSPHSAESVPTTFSRAWTNERWPSLAEWIIEVWIGESDV